MNIILDGGMTVIHDKSRNRGVDAVWRVTGLLCELLAWLRYKHVAREVR